jgi:hypothetical protein
MFIVREGHGGSPRRGDMVLRRWHIALPSAIKRPSSMTCRNNGIRLWWRDVSLSSNSRKLFFASNNNEFFDY